MRPGAKPGPQFVQLEMREVQPLEESLVHQRAVRASPRQPARDRSMPMPKHPRGGRDRQPFGQRGQHFGNPVGSGFEPIERRSAARAEGAAARLAAQGLYPLVAAMGAVTHQRMNERIRDPIGRHIADWGRRSPGCQCAWVRHGGF